MSLVKKMQNWAARTLIRKQRIKEVRYCADELNEMIVESLPFVESFDVPGGSACLTVMSANISIGIDNQEGLIIQLTCGIEISSLKLQLYRAHLKLAVKATPYYSKEQKSIRLKDAALSSLTFVNDDYLLIKSTNDIIRMFTPGILKGLVDVTLTSALSVIGSAATPQVKQYMGLFADANKQKVLDFHRQQIAALVVGLVESPKIAYQLDPTDFEEKLFFDLGQHIAVDQHQLVFKF